MPEAGHVDMHMTTLKSVLVSADDTAALLRQLNVGPVDVLGYSDGGIVTWESPFVRQT
jgi:pimeloyl-ACP methyl ester carboxylesterase